MPLLNEALGAALLSMRPASATTAPNAIRQFGGDRSALASALAGTSDKNSTAYRTQRAAISRWERGGAISRPSRRRLAEVVRARKRPAVITRRLRFMRQRGGWVDFRGMLAIEDEDYMRNRAIRVFMAAWLMAEWLPRVNAGRLIASGRVTNAAASGFLSAFGVAWLGESMGEDEAREAIVAVDEVDHLSITVGRGA